MPLMLLASLAALNIAPPGDLVRPDEDAAFHQDVETVIGRVIKQRGGDPCPQPQVVFEPARRAGMAAVLLGATPGSPVAPDAVVFKQSFRIAGCAGQVRHENMYLARKTAGGWLFASAAPGDTLAGPILVRDTLRMALGFAVAGRGQSCTNGGKIYDLRDTQVTVPPQTGSTSSGWTERWTQQSCGDDRTVLVTFTPTADGGTDFKVKPDWPGAPL